MGAVPCIEGCLAVPLASTRESQHHPPPSPHHDSQKYLQTLSNVPTGVRVEGHRLPPVKDHWFRESTNFTRFGMKNWQLVCNVAPISLKAVLLLYFLGDFFDFILQRFSHSLIFKHSFFFFFLLPKYYFLKYIIFVSLLKNLISLRI